MCIRDRDYAVWQQEYLQSDEIKKQRDYWRTTLSGDLPVLNLPADYPRKAGQNGRGARREFQIDQKTTARLRAFAKEHNATLFMAVLAVYTVFLSHYTGQEDVIVATPVSGRLRPELQNIAGAFINTIPVSYTHLDVYKRQG